MTTNSSAGLSNNLVGVLTYFFLILGGVVVLLVAPYKDDKELRFHAFQSIFLGLAWMVVSIGLSIVFSIGPLYALWPLQSLLSLAFFVGWVYLMFRTFQGQRLVLPVIGPMAEQQA